MAHKGVEIEIDGIQKSDFKKGMNAWCAMSFIWILYTRDRWIIIARLAE